MKDEVETSTCAPLNTRVGRTFNLKGLNWVSVPGGRTLTKCDSTSVCPSFRSWNLIYVTEERAKQPRECLQ